MDMKPIIWNNDHGRSKIPNQNNSHTRDTESLIPKPSSVLPEKKPVDSFDKTPETINDEKDVAGAVTGSGLKISFHFDLFYQLSQKVSAKMGQKGLDRFTEVTASVAETFKGSFDLKIDGIGSYLKGTENSLNISPEMTNGFLDSVDELAALSPHALENFLRESDRFFTELQSKLGPAGDALDDIKGQMQEQAKSFFDGVQKIRSDAMGESSEVTGPVVPILPATVAHTSSPENSGGNLIPLKFGDKSSATQNEYQDFLKNFLDYTEKFRQRVVKDFFNTMGLSKGLLKAQTPQESLPSPKENTEKVKEPVGTIPTGKTESSE